MTDELKVTTGTRYATSPLSKDLKETYRKNLIEYIEKEKPYLDSALTLEKLSERVRISKNYLSQIINEIIGKNFYDFINSYRIIEAKSLLS